MKNIELAIILVTLLLYFQGVGASNIITVCSSGCNFTNISSASNNASAGDTVLVGDGNYTDTVSITKSLNILSVNGSTSTTVTPADSTDNLFSVFADNVNISGFTITGADDDSVFFPEGPAGIYLEGASYCNISSNLLSSNFYGIYLVDFSDNNLIAGNNITSNLDAGIITFDANDNIIYNNFFSDNFVNADDFDFNSWNTSRTLGTNIINRTYIGGNFWDDYSGVDLDGDYIGDTLIPHDGGFIDNPGDYLPLINPSISNIQSSSVTGISAVITWDTNVLSDSLVKFGASSGNYISNQSNTSSVSTHNIVLTGLSTNTTYYYVVNSTDANNYSLQSNEYTFTTSLTGKMRSVCSSGCNFTKIQEGIDNSSVGDVLFVYNGSYNENLVIDKRLTIQGQDKATTIVNGNGSGACFEINSNSVNVTGFTIQNCSYGIYLKSSNNSIFTNNLIRKNRYSGIYLSYSNNNVIKNNDVTRNQYYYGIGLTSSDGNTIDNNYFYENWYGIYVFDSCSNKARENVADNNTYYGIFVSSTNCSYPPLSNELTNNNASWNHVGFAAILYSSLDYSSNLALNNTYAGFFIVAKSGSNISLINTIDQGGSFLTTDPEGTRVIVDRAWQSSAVNATYEISFDNLGIRPDTFSLNVTNIDGAALNFDTSPVTLNPGQTVTRTMTVGNGTVGDYEVFVEAISQNDSNVRDLIKTTTIVTGTPANDSIIQGSNVTNSNIKDSAVYISNISDSNISRSIIRNSQVSNTDLADIELVGGVVAGGTISSGNITIGSITYEINGSISLTQLITGQDLEDSTLIGVKGTELEVAAGNSDLDFKISAEADYIGGEIGVQRSTVNPIESTVQPNNVGGYSYVEVSRNIEGSIDWVYIKIYYSQSEVDSKNIDESTLRIEFYNTTNQSWQNITPGGVNTAANYVFANSSHFSILGLRGDIKPISISSGGTKSYSPPLIPTSGTTSISSTDTTSLVKELGYYTNQFYIAPPEIEGPLAALDIFVTTPEQVDRLDDITWRQVASLDGDSYEIISELALSKYPQGSSTVIITRGDMGVDACASVAYAKALDIPIILVEPDSIPFVVRETLEKLGAENVVIVGGVEAVSSSVESDLPDPARIWGMDRYETAVKIAEALMSRTSVDTLVIADGLNPDPTSVMVAAYYRAPMVYTKGNVLTESTREFLEKYSFKKIIFSGTPAGVEEEINSIARLT